MVIEDIQKGGVNIPKLVALFLQNLTGGTDFRRSTSNLKQIRTKSISEDVVFAKTGELKKPQNHLMLGIPLKSLTEDQKVVQIMSSFTDYISYHTKKEIKTEVTFSKKNFVYMVWYEVRSSM